MRWREKPIPEYYRWFAWHPVKIRKEWVWLEHVWFRYLQGTYFKEYYNEEPHHDE